MSKKVNLDVSQKVDITCRRGDTFTLSLTFNDSDGNPIELLTEGYSFLMQVRKRSRNDGSIGLILGTANIGVQSPNNFEPIEVDDLGRATITASASTMRNVPSGVYVYDIQQIVDNVHTTVLNGTFKVNEDVSEALS